MKPPIFNLVSLKRKAHKNGHRAKAYRVNNRKSILIIKHWENETLFRLDAWENPTSGKVEFIYSIEIEKPFQLIEIEKSRFMAAVK